MKYNCTDETHSAMRGAVATLSIYTRRYGAEDSRTVEARKVWERYRALALMETAEEFFGSLTDTDVMRTVEALTENRSGLTVSAAVVHNG